MSCVHTKDHLYEILNAANDVHETCTVADTICTILKHTEGLWLEARYCYKAKEIAGRVKETLERFIGTCQHHKTHEMLAVRRDTARRLEEHYHKLQQQQMTHFQNCSLDLRA